MELLPILIYTAICIAFFKNFSDVGVNARRCR
jgi:hypothetical protein